MLFAAPPRWNAQRTPNVANPAPQRHSQGLTAGEVVPLVPPTQAAAADPPRRGYTARGVPEEQAPPLPQAPAPTPEPAPAPAPLTLPPPAALGLAEPPDGTAPVAELDSGRAHQRLRELG